MSQEQPRRSEGISYGDVFNVSGELASKPVAPRDAAAMQAAETMMLGKTQKGGPAAVMQSAADVNEMRGVVGHDDVTNVARDQGVRITEGYVGDRVVFSESVGGEVVGAYASRRDKPAANGRDAKSHSSPATPGDDASITIGEALEATAFAAGNRPVDQSDAAAIQAAEIRATGRGEVMPGGIGADAQAAAILNPQIMRDQDKTKLGDVLREATDRLPDDKPVTREDARRVVAAEWRNDPGNSPHPGGVAHAIATAAKLNQEGPMRG